MSSKKPARSPAQPAAAAAAAAHTSVTPGAIAPLAVMNASSSYEGITINAPPYDPVVAKQLLEAFRPRLAAIPADKLLSGRLSARPAALTALGVYASVTQVDAIHERFKAQQKAGELSPQILEDLKSASFIVLYTQAQAEAAGAFQSNAKVPPELVAEGAQIEKRMQKLCEYKFEGDAEIAPRLAWLSPGTGYEDLASDLFGYADIYEMRPAEVALDTTHYRETDVADARRVAGKILGHVADAMSSQARQWYELLQRSSALLVQIYFEIQQTGLFLQRYDPKRNERFPSLFAAGRPGRPRKNKSEEPGQGGSGGGAPPGG